MQMLQDLKLNTKEQNQFLGDLFEGFLDNGVKQSEGQFFTPLPIVKFIISSLPVKAINTSTEIPKVIDYACGAGHFLNEYAEQIKKYIDKSKLPTYYSNIYGVEKEYRLSKVAKVSSFMYGQDDINIIYGDALDSQDQIEDNSYSLIVANPPYSVKGFLETLSERQRMSYQLSSHIDKIDTNNSIELFFLERAQQLLMSGGIAGIIVPSSILSNGKLYSKSRKMLLEAFDIIAIAEFGSQTFGSTGTNTITLFLRKKMYPPDEATFFRYAVKRWFSDEDIENGDVKIIEAYCDNIGVDYSLYSEIKSNNIDNLLELEMFKEYFEQYQKSQKAKNIAKKKITSKYTKEDKEKEYNIELQKYIKQLELEKVYFFALVNSQKNDVIIVKSPKNNEEKKQFLGYEWSKRKGQEGIKYIGSPISDEEMEIHKNQAISSIQTPLFNPLDLEDSSKINTIIRNNFIESKVYIPNELEKFVTSISLVDMIDFSQASFDAQLRTSGETKIVIESKYPMKPLKDLAKIEKGQVITKAETKEGDIKVVAGGKEYAYTHNTFNREANIITVSASGANAGFVNYWEERIFASDTITIQAKTVLQTKFIYNLLKSYQNDIFRLARGAAQPHVYISDLAKIPIPIVPENIQSKILSEVNSLDEQYKNSRMKIEEYYKKIYEIFEKLDILGGVRYKLKQIGIMRMCKRIYKNETAYQGDIPFYKIGTLGSFADSYITREKFLEYKEKYPFPKKGEILISASGTIGKTFVYNGEDAYYQDSNIVWLDHNESIVSNKYLEKILPYVKWKSSEGSTIKRVYGKDFDETEIPVYANQEAIIDKISELEINIEKEKDKIIAIEEKKAMIIRKYIN